MAVPKGKQSKARTNRRHHGQKSRGIGNNISNTGRADCKRQRHPKYREKDQQH